jgi:hypothetical protein
MNHKGNRTKGQEKTQRGSCTFYILNSKNDIIWGKKVNHVGARRKHSDTTNPEADDVTNMESGFPSYLHIIANGRKIVDDSGWEPKGAGYDVDGNAYTWSWPTSDPHDFSTGTIETAGIREGISGRYSQQMDSSTDITIDSISVKGFEGEISNATIGDLNREPRTMTISGGKDALLLDDDYGVNDYWLLGDPDAIKGKKLEMITENSNTVAVPTYISWGTKSNVWDDGGDPKTNHIFMGGFGVSDKSNNDSSDTSKSLNFVDSSSYISDVTVLIPDDSATATDQGTWLVQD